MHPPFSLFATKKTGRARSKRKTLAAGIFPQRGKIRPKTGVSVTGAVRDGSLYRMRFGLREQGSYCPAFDGVGAAFGVVIEIELLLFPLPLPPTLRGEESKGEGPQPLPFVPF